MKLKDFNLLYNIDVPNYKIVTGEGKEDADVVLIGEAPGGEEEAQGRPFVGKAGKNLSEFLELIDLKREDIYITNTVKFRPTKVSETGSISNRTPTDTEVKEFLPYLKWELKLLNPKLIVTLGNTPLKALLGNTVTVGNLHGKLTEYEDKKLFPLFHPASLIYNPELKPMYTEDILRLKELIIKEKFMIK